MTQNLPIAFELLQAIRAYLGGRPFDEVAGMIQGLEDSAKKFIAASQEAAPEIQPEPA